MVAEDVDEVISTIERQCRYRNVKENAVKSEPGYRTTYKYF